jgi:hypothetical protein
MLVENYDLAEAQSLLEELRIKHQEAVDEVEKQKAAFLAVMPQKEQRKKFLISFETMLLTRSLINQRILYITTCSSYVLSAVLSEAISIEEGEVQLNKMNKNVELVIKQSEMILKEFIDMNKRGKYVLKEKRKSEN